MVNMNLITNSEDCANHIRGKNAGHEIIETSKQNEIILMKPFEKSQKIHDSSGESNSRKFNQKQGENKFSFGSVTMMILLFEL